MWIENFLHYSSLYSSSFVLLLSYKAHIYTYKVLKLIFCWKLYILYIIVTLESDISPFFYLNLYNWKIKYIYRKPCKRNLYLMNYKANTLETTIQIKKWNFGGCSRTNRSCLPLLKSRHYPDFYGDHSLVFLYSFGIQAWIPRLYFMFPISLIWSVFWVSLSIDFPLHLPSPQDPSLLLLLTVFILPFCCLTLTPILAYFL